VVLPDGRTHVLERHDAALLAMLALQGPTPRNHAGALLWPDVDVKAAQSNLRQRLFRLKRRVGAAIVESEPALALAAGVTHDLDADASEAAGALDPRGSQLLGGLDYSDFGELSDWVSQARDRQRARVRDWLARAASELERDGRIAEALRLAERLVVEDRSAEHAQRRVMRLHYRRGDRGAALAAFTRCCDALAEDMGTVPGPETRELAALIERSGTLPAAVAAPSPVAVLRPPTLVGRDPAWAEIEAAWQRGQVVLIRGDAGAGKTRLASDFAAAHGEAEICRARPGDAQVPYALFVRLLGALIDRHGAAPPAWVEGEFARLLPGLSVAPAPGKLETLRMRQALGAAMAHWQVQGLLVLVIDDLQFADEASLELLFAWLAQGPRPQVLMTLRAGEAPSAVTAWTDQATRSDLCTIDLAALDREAIAALIESLAISGLEVTAWIEPLRRHTGGNPLFLLETLMAELMIDGSAPARPGATLAAPARVGLLLEQRLQRLRPSALRLARVAAVAGPDFSVEIAARVLASHALDLADDWALLEHAHILRDGAFAHDLILEATRRTVPGPIAQVLHGAIAAALEAGTPASASAPARIAEHWWQAEAWDRAAAQFERAAGDAFARSRPQEELQLWDRAALCHERAGDPDAAFVARARAIDPAIINGPNDQVALRAEALLAASRNDAQRLAALLAQAKHFGTNTDHALAAPAAAEALALARRLGRVQGEFLAATILGVALAYTGQVEAGIALFDAMAPRVEDIADPMTRGGFCSAFGAALHSAGRLDDSIAWIRRAIELGERTGDLNDLAINVGNLAALLGRTGRHAQALEAAERAHALHLRLGGPQGVPYAVSQLNLAMFYLVPGRYDDALAALERGRVAGQFGNATALLATVEHHLANLFLQLGQPARARQALTPLADDAPPIRQARRAVIDARIDEYAQRPASDPLLAVLRSCGKGLTPIDRFGIELAIAAALPPDESLARCPELRAAALAHGQPSVAVSALIREADAWRRAGEAGRAAAAARTAVTEAAERGWHDMHAPVFWWLAVQALDAGGAADEAVAALRTGTRWIEGALPHVPQAFVNGYLQRSHGVPELIAMARARLRT
jgi:DNA-binding SARP family transcriptional activator